MEDKLPADWLLSIIKMHALKGLKRVAENNGERVARGTIIAGLKYPRQR